MRYSKIRNLDRKFSKKSTFPKSLSTSFIVFLTGVIVYMFLNIEIKDKAKIGNFNDMKNLVKSKSVILIGLIILTAYMGYKITDI